MRISTAAGVGSVASLLAGIGVPIAFPHVEPWVGQYLLIAAGLLFALALGLWLKGGSNGAVTVSTTGPHSPAIGSVARDLNIHHHAPPSREHISPHGPQTPSLRLQGRADQPSLSVADALELIQQAIGTGRDAWLELRQAARDDEIGVWGRPETTGPEIGGRRRFGEMRELIEPFYWQKWRIVRDLAKLREIDEPQTEPEFGDHTYDSYTNITVSRDEIEGKWLKPPPTRQARRTNYGPGGWMR